MRVQRPLYAPKPVAEIRLRVVAREIPGDGEVDITDVQLQSGELASGVTVNPREAGTTAGGSHYRNGVVHAGMEVVALANIDKATPTRMEVLNSRGDVRIGSYRFGERNNFSAYADARTHRASHGWGRPPVITERSDLNLRTYGITGRVHLRLRWEDREPGENTP